ncbi:MAG: hypothetical protein COX77_00030 [Candidatus Komeilibacteria bacterium CG_4_10_14_0_2_um_filter_37_10]|uniref:Glycosyltransferase family 1 protein n=1 Tax=Candidatus Komeilibacteria bacterium CG_4_10_14_0_2_um_filter_37_10 TaxID=1974470 RepID=A0A2M7VGS1_9BACT|nr:MAG: hypothetical protein COX77_00030 [Candidatus Komeilibacteria bacterium CG_4_10_14_0_2_um_filter_37_10]
MATIGLEATRASKQQKTGTEWYAWHIIKQLTSIDRNNQYRIYFKDHLDPDLLSVNNNVKFISLPWVGKKLWTNLRLSWELLLRPVDVFLSVNSVPFFGLRKLIVVIHDLGFYREPQLYQPLERWFHKFEHRIMLAKADRIIAVSENTKKDIGYYFPQYLPKVTVILNGFDHTVFQPLSSEQIELAKKRFGLPVNYLLYIGRIETKKNILYLVKSFSQTMAEHDWHLLLAGRPGNYGYQEVVDYICLHKIDNRIHLLGYLDNEKYHQLLAAASIFVFPTKFEGFGIPVIEALSCGVPVLCSDLPVLQEVAGTAAEYFSLKDENSLANKINFLINHEEKREQLRQLSRGQASKYSWHQCAQAMQEQIRLLVDKS